MADEVSTSQELREGPEENLDRPSLEIDQSKDIRWDFQQVLGDPYKCHRYPKRWIRSIFPTQREQLLRIIPGQSEVNQRLGHVERGTLLAQSYR